MKYKLLTLTLSAYLLTGCNGMQEATPPKPLYQVTQVKKQEAYNITMKKVGRSTLKDSKYQRIALDTAENKIWFKTLTYRLWDREITKQEFIEEGLGRYPDHRYEFEFIAEGLNL
jgi:hypothetical protein